MEKEQKQELIHLIIGAVLFVAAMVLTGLLNLPGWVQLCIYLVPYLVLGFGVLKEAGENILHGEVFDENFLMAIATIGALVIAEYPEAVFVMLFYRVGELFEDFAVGRSRRAVSDLMDIRPEYANVERDGALVRVAPEELQVGDAIVVRPGEKIPVDGEVTEGCSELNTAALTGESLPRAVEPGSSVISGCVNLNGLLKIRVTRAYCNSTVARVLALVETSAQNKAHTENFITRFARYYTPAVVLAAVLLAVIPSLITGAWAQWTYRALTFLVVSCPCAFVIAVPLSFFCGIGGASSRGILVKGSNYLEALARCDCVVFDKTGTLTQGRFTVAQTKPVGCTAEELLRLAAQVEGSSTHPIASSIRAAAGALPAAAVSEVQELAGLGLQAMVDGCRTAVGNEKLMKQLNVPYDSYTGTGTAVYVAQDGRFMGWIEIRDEAKPTAAQAIRALSSLGVHRTVMLTGDRREAGEQIARELGITDVYAQLLPEDKVTHVEQLLQERTRGGKLAFVGDGINDAPVLARADVGVAMGAFGSDAAIEAADVVLMDDDPVKLALAVRIARKTRRIVMQNIVLALTVKFGVLILCAFGVVDMWAAVFADVGVMVIAVLNAIRAMRIKPDSDGR